MLQFTGNPNNNLVKEIVHSSNDIIQLTNLNVKTLGMVFGKGYHAGMMGHP